MHRKLIYILGTGRSGTTILDIALGNCEDAISLGEVNRFFKRGGKAPKRLTNDKVFLFWDEIKQKLDKSLGQKQYSSLDKLCYNNEYHTKFPKIFFGKVEETYLDLLKKQYESIFSIISDKKVLVESSKYPTRAINISKVLDESTEICYIYLKKDPVKVVNSFRKKGLEQPAKSFFMSNLYYLIVNTFCHLSSKRLRKMGHKVVTIKYEDFITEPSRILDQISTAFKMEVNQAKAKIENGKMLSTGYLFDGNRIRLKPHITLRRDPDNNVKKGLGYLITRGFNHVIYR